MYDIFSLPAFSFPENFLWGSATAGHQIEGDNVHSQNYVREIREKYQEPSGKACNHYQLFREDVDLIASLGHQAYRCSIEWSRIEPEPGRWDAAALDHYKELLDRLHARGIKTFVTLNHGTWPQWFEELGGMTKRENIAPFLRYIEKAVTELRDRVDFWMVVNEATHTLHGDPKVGFNFIRLHGQAYRLIKSLTDAPVSSAQMAVEYFPTRFYDELDRIMTAWKDFRTNGVFLHAIRTGELISPGVDAEACPEVKDAIDFWGVNLYTRHMIDSRRAKEDGPRLTHKQLKMIPVDFYLEEMFPEGMDSMVTRFSATGKPVYITENGCSCDDDRFRIVYLTLYLSALHDAMQRGADVRGYLYWSLMDNYEWHSFLPRFGLVDVNFKTFVRTPKPSAYFYRDIIQNHGFSQEILARYLPAMPSLKKQ